MPPKTPFDPFTMWKSIYDQTEANWNETLQEMMGKESFSESMGDTLNHFLQYQELVNKMTESYLKGVNMPSRGELSDIASLVVNLEGKIDDINDDMDDKLDELNTSKEIKQIRRAVTNLDKKLDGVLKAVELITSNDQPKEKQKPKAKKETKATKKTGTTKKS